MYKYQSAGRWALPGATNTRQRAPNTIRLSAQAGSDAVFYSSGSNTVSYAHSSP
ncbi:MAG: hypothetical protein ACOCWH_04720 [Spirochaetota bacterium]